MCGIVGVYGARAPSLEPVVRSANDRLTHRGPDGKGVGSYANGVLAMRRLAIVDLETGDQPISCERDTTHVVANAEIYNHIEMRARHEHRGHTYRSTCDVEAIVHSYEDEGLDFVHHLRGMFALALLDERRDCLVLARDRFGQKPLLYAELPGGGIAFASELTALVPILQAAGVAITIDGDSISDFLSLGAVPQPFTIYRGVRSVKPGHYVVATPEGIREESYWQPVMKGRQGWTRPDALEMVRNQVAESVRLCLRSDVPVGAFLSGGIDSSIIAYEVAQAGGRDVVTYSVTVDDPALDEGPIAASTSARYGLANEQVRIDIDPLNDLHAVVRAYGQPFADSSALATFAVARATSTHRKVVLTGDGGDEVFGGYRRHLAAYVAGRIPVPARKGLSRTWQGVVGGRTVGARRSSMGFADRFFRGLGSDGAARYLAWTQDMMVEADKQVLLFDRNRTTESLIDAALCHDQEPLKQQFAGDRLITLPSDLLVKMDIATSAWSLEARAPLLDHVLAEAVWGVPTSFMFHRGRTKALLRDAYAGLLPEAVRTAPKKGFEVPLARWLNREWQPLIHDTVLDRSAQVLNYLDAQFVRDLFGGTALPTRNRAYLMYAILCLELWLRQPDLPGCLRCAQPKSMR